MVFKWRIFSFHRFFYIYQLTLYCKEELSLPRIYVSVGVFISIWTRGLLLYSMDFNLLLSVFFFFLMSK